jgi:electron transport complex protein RnfB
MNKEFEEVEKRRAFVRCIGDCDATQNRFIYHGKPTCESANLELGGQKACNFACLGFGDCEQVCPYGAIEINKEVAKIDRGKCTGCGLCIPACPKDLIISLPLSSQVSVGCKATDNEEITLSNCSTGCTGCKKCEEICPFDAASVTDALATIDPVTCTNCGVCAVVCPTKVIIDMIPARPKVYIDTSCDGCDLCTPVCPLDAIEGDKGSRHKIVNQKCNGCGICLDICPPKSIKTIGSLAYNVHYGEGMVRHD